MNSTRDITSLLQPLSMRNIISALPRETFTYAERSHRASLLNAVLHLPLPMRKLLEDSAAAKTRTSSTGTDHAVSTPALPFHSNLRPPLFLQSVPELTRRMRIAKFIDATGNRATTTTSPCAVCAGSFFCKDLCEMQVSALARTNLLAPTRPHIAHELTEGMLLHRSPRGFRFDEQGHAVVDVCQSCLSDVRRHKTPPLSLANGMWIGNVPIELSVLTLPERVLVARHFPAAYIIKLYPKKKGARLWASEGMHSGMRGNVSTYRLNTDDIVKMTESQTMPPPCSVLAATIGVTFVGPGNFPQKTMPRFLRVNRARVHDALQWLKHNNPLYENIVISADRLNDLPLDDVPLEIWAVTKHSDDVSRLADENDGYVPDEDSGEDGQEKPLSFS